jgi:hypothetical protein
MKHAPPGLLAMEKINISAHFAKSLACAGGFPSPGLPAALA